MGESDGVGEVTSKENQHQILSISVSLSLSLYLQVCLRIQKHLFGWIIFLQALYGHILLGHQ